MKLLATLAALALIASLASASVSPGRASERAFLFTYFVGNGESGLHLAWSTDGYAWEALNEGRSFLRPEVGTARLMRDPCAVRGPDGTYHMVWTSGWWENNIGYASTRDFVHWSPQKAIPVMAHEPAVRNSWAPEVAFDGMRGEFIIFWASTIPGRFPQTAGASEDDLNHRIYCTTTKDFEAFAPTTLFLDPGFSVIDATFLRTAGRDHLIVKDETRHPPRKYLQIAPAEGLLGPFGELSAPLTPEGLWVEGPSAIQIGDDYLVYFDAYTQRHYGAMRSRDLRTWEDVTAEMRFPNEGTPQRMRHGSVLEVPAGLVESLRAYRSDPAGE
jgi:hypothetical protein